MSWTVQEEPQKDAQTLHEANLEQLLQKVVRDDEEDYVPSPNKASGVASGGGSQPPSSLYTKSSQVFTSPAPLVPADLATPVKDPLESFNSWVRTQGGQTPNSSRSSPTPGGMGASPSNATSPPSASRHVMQATALPYVANTPQKNTSANDLMMLTPNGSSAANGGNGQGPRGALAGMMHPQPHGKQHPQQQQQQQQQQPAALDNILEHRKLLLQQMEELALQEMELRQLGANVGAAPFQPMSHHLTHHHHMDNWSPMHYQQQQPQQHHHPHPHGHHVQQQQQQQQQQQPMLGQAHSPYAAAFNPAAVTMVGSPSAHSQMLTAESIRGRVYETAKDQHGCRFLQRWLDNNFDGETTQAIITEIIPHVAELMTDQYANFLVQKLFDIMSHDVRYQVAQVAAPHMSLIALTPHGTFSVQKLIETIATREEMEIVREALTMDVVRLVKDVHGNHVIQKVLQRFEHPDKQFIYDAVSDDCASISTNKQGCCVLQRCLEFASPMQHKSMVACILSCCLQIVQDPFGNYVLQYVLEANDPSINDRIATIFLHHLVPLSMNKFSSNVMEKVLRGASQHIRDIYVDTMKDPSIIGGLIQDDFGNYVVQTALTMSSAPQVEALVAVIRPLMPLIRNAPYAKKLEAKMDLILKKKAGGVSTGPLPRHMGSASNNNTFSPSAPGGGMRHAAPHDPYDQGSIQSPPHQQQQSPNHHSGGLQQQQMRGGNGGGFGNGNRGGQQQQQHHHMGGRSGPPQHMTPWSNSPMAM